MYIVQYHHKLAPNGIKVFGAGPGLVVTNLMNKENQRARGGVEGQVGGERIATVVKGERDIDVEGFVMCMESLLGDRRYCVCG